MPTNACQGNPTSCASRASSNSITIGMASGRLTSGLTLISTAPLSECNKFLIQLFISLIECFQLLFNLITSLLKERTIVDCALEEEVNKKRVCCTKRMNVKEYIEENGCVLTEWVSETREREREGTRLGVGKKALRFTKIQQVLKRWSGIEI